MVLEFYHTMTSRGVSDQMQIRFSIDGRLRILRASDITVSLSLLVVMDTSTDYRQWPHPSPREMICSLFRDTAVESILFRQKLPQQMLLTDHVLQSNLFPLQNFLQRRGSILEALYRMSKGFLFNPAEL